MAYPNLSSDNEPGGAFTVELTEKNPPMDHGQIGFDGLDDKEPSSVPNEQRELLKSDTDLTRPRLNTAQRVSCILRMCHSMRCAIIV